MKRAWIRHAAVFVIVALVVVASLVACDNGPAPTAPVTQTATVPSAVVIK